MLNKHSIVPWELNNDFIIPVNKGCNSSHQSWLTSFQLWNAICNCLSWSCYKAASPRSLTGIKGSGEGVQEKGQDRGRRHATALGLLPASSWLLFCLPHRTECPKAPSGALFRHLLLQPSSTSFVSFFLSIPFPHPPDSGIAMAPTITPLELCSVYTQCTNFLSETLLWTSHCLLHVPLTLISVCLQWLMTFTGAPSLDLPPCIPWHVPSICAALQFYIKIKFRELSDHPSLPIKNFNYCHSFFFFNLFYFFGRVLVFFAAHRLSLVVASGGYSLLRCAGFSLRWLLLLQSTGSVVVAHRLSCFAACGIFPDQGSNLCPLHWQADS